MTTVNPIPDQPVDWTPRDTPLGAPAAPVPPQQFAMRNDEATYVPASAQQYYQQPQQYYYQAPPQVVHVEQLPRATTAVAALACALVGLVTVWCAFGSGNIVLTMLGAVPLLGVVFGHVAQHEIAKSNGGMRGREMAFWSLMLAYPASAFWLFELVYAIGTHRFG